MICCKETNSREGIYVFKDGWSTFTAARAFRFAYIYSIQRDRIGRIIHRQRPHDSIGPTPVLSWPMVTTNTVESCSSRNSSRQTARVGYLIIFLAISSLISDGHHIQRCRSCYIWLKARSFSGPVILRSQLPQFLSLGSGCWGRRSDSTRICHHRRAVQHVAKSSFRTGQKSLWARPGLFSGYIFSPQNSPHCKYCIGFQNEPILMLPHSRHS